MPRNAAISGESRLPKPAPPPLDLRCRFRLCEVLQQARRGGAGQRGTSMPAYSTAMHGLSAGACIVAAPNLPAAQAQRASAPTAARPACRGPCRRHPIPAAGSADPRACGRAQLTPRLCRPPPRRPPLPPPRRPRPAPPGTPRSARRGPQRARSRVLGHAPWQEVRSGAAVCSPSCRQQQRTHRQQQCTHRQQNHQSTTPAGAGSQQERCAALCCAAPQFVGFAAMRCHALRCAPSPRCG